MARLVNVQEAADELSAGGLVAFPTETVYGLGADARNEGAVRQVFARKGRPADHPLIVHVANLEHASRVGTLSPMASRIAAKFWPGPLTLIVPKHPDVPLAVTGGLASVAIRVPAHPVAARLLDLTGFPLVGPSANRYGHVSPTSAEHVLTDFEEGNLSVLDGGECELGIESTIIEVVEHEIRIARHGLIEPGDLSAFGLPVVWGTADTSRIVAPGNKARHYAPNLDFRWVDSDAAMAGAMSRLLSDGPCTLLSAEPPLTSAIGVDWRPIPKESKALAKVLYKTLRQLELDGIRRAILFEPRANDALRDRLKRASHDPGK